MADLNFKHEVNNKIPKFIDMCEKIYGEFVDKIFVGHDPYVFRF